MGTFGERLQQERELRGITLEEIAEATKIGTRALHALEEEDFAALPGGIFNKGFVRSYARYLGIDEEQAVTDYLAAMKAKAAAAGAKSPGAGPAVAAGAGPAGASSAETSAAASASASSSLSSPAGVGGQPRPAVVVALGVVLLAAVSLALWKFYPGDAADAGEPGATAPVQQVNEAAAPETPEAVQTAAPETQSEPEPSAATVPPAAATLAAAAPAGGAGFELEVRAREEAWVSLTADGELVYEGVLQAADTRSVRAREQVVFKTGNAGGIELSQNGSALGALGAPGQVRTVTVTAEGVRR